CARGAAQRADAGGDRGGPPPHRRLRRGPRGQPRLRARAGGARGGRRDLTATAPRERHHVQSLGRGLAVIRALAQPGPGSTLAEVAAVTGLSRATARRFLLTLAELGYVRGGQGRFVLTP